MLEQYEKIPLPSTSQLGSINQNFKDTYTQNKNEPEKKNEENSEIHTNQQDDQKYELHIYNRSNLSEVKLPRKEKVKLKELLKPK